MPKKFLVPQYIEMEDKIVGPLTMNQFLYVLTGGVLCYLSFTFFDKILSYPLIFISGSFFFSMAFVKFNERPLPKILEALIFYYLRPRERIWHKTEELPELKEETPKKTKAQPPEVSPKSKKEQLKELSEKQAS